MNEIEIMASGLGITLILISGLFYLYDKHKNPWRWKK
jgi:hypothetical protein